MCNTEDTNMKELAIAIALEVRYHMLLGNGLRSDATRNDWLAGDTIAYYRSYALGCIGWPRGTRGAWQ